MGVASYTKAGMSSGSGCHHQAHEHRQAVRAVSEVVHSRSRLTFATAVLVAVNLVVTCAVLYFTTPGGENPLRPREVWRSFVPALGVQTVVNGVILLAFKRTRHVGAGALVGGLVVAALFCLWLLLVVWPNTW